jgi:dipeptide/tripeptide permease
VVVECLHWVGNREMLVCGGEILVCGCEMLVCGRGILVRGREMLVCGRGMFTAGREALRAEWKICKPEVRCIMK